MPLKALIVDDEYPAREELRYLLEKHPEIQVVGEATNAYEAMELIEALDYAVLFLDIDMPGFTGLELAQKIKERDKAPLVVFITAHEEFALDAFAVDAVDYLLKPIDPARLAKTVQKIQEIMSLRSSTPKNHEAERKTGSAHLGLIPVEFQGKTILLAEENIVYVHASNDYTYIKTARERYLTRFTLKELEQRLNPDQFYRCHRSYLVNIKKAKAVIPLYNGTLILIVDDAEKSEVPVSRAQAKRIRQILGL
ncbi:MAG TPA: response regulator transcription factor [Clostridia bacterium]|nr:response regulator transcription factor [Clostridia bacterium]